MTETENVLIQKEYESVLIISKDAKTGRVNGRVNVNIWHDSNGRGRIESLWVAQIDRKSGIGTMLLAEAEKEASARGCSIAEIYWDAAHGENWEYGWYLKNGYKNGFMQYNGHLQMEKQL